MVPQSVLREQHKVKHQKFRPLHENHRLYETNPNRLLTSCWNSPGCFRHVNFDVQDLYDVYELTLSLSRIKCPIYVATLIPPNFFSDISLNHRCVRIAPRTCNFSFRGIVLCRNIEQCNSRCYFRYEDDFPTGENKSG